MPAKRAKWMLGLIAAGLFVSGITIWPSLWELKTIVRILGDGTEPAGTIHRFLLEVIRSLESVGSSYPFLFYAGDWLAFAHIVLAILFAGAARDPVRNVWVVQCGLIMCALVPVLAGICVPLRGLPWQWFLVDFAFAPAAALPLAVALHDIRCLTNSARPPLPSARRGP